MGTAGSRWMVLALVAGLSIGVIGGFAAVGGGPASATAMTPTAPRYSIRKSSKPVGAPARFASNKVDVVTIIRTADKRRPISPLIYGLNANSVAGLPAPLLRAVSFVRRGGDRSNAYNWETNVSNGAFDNGWANDLYLAAGLANQNAPAGVDLSLISANRAAGRGSMVPFVLNDYVAGPVGRDIPWDTSGFNREQFFRRVQLVKPTPFAASPDLNDGTVYTDEHFAFLRAHFPGTDIYAPGPTAGDGRHRQRAGPLAPQLPDAPSRGRRTDLREQRRSGWDARPGGRVHRAVHQAGQTYKNARAESRR